jgi:heptosyltransferase-2
VKVIISTGESIATAKNILVRGTNWIGDAVMTIPAVTAIRHTFPESRISVLAKPWVAEVYRLCPAVDQIILFHDPGVHSGIRGKIRLAGELRVRRFDAAILLQNAIEAAIVSRLAGIPIRGGYNSDARGFLLTHSVQRTKAIKEAHQIDYYVEMVKSLGCMLTQKSICLQPDRDSDSISDDIFRQHGIEEDRLLIGLAPGATYGPAKKWFPERFAAVADRLIDEFAAQVILFGSGEDRKSADEVQQNARHSLINLSGNTNLKEAIALMARCALFISNDSGLMHVAGALNVPLVAIFGSTNPATTSPVGNKSVVICKNVSCSPCLKEVCPTDFRCMDMVSIDDVYETARDLLKP